MTMSSYDIRNDDSAHNAEKVAKVSASNDVLTHAVNTDIANIR